jgi:hypothetical protein
MAHPGAQQRTQVTSPSGDDHYDAGTLIGGCIRELCKAHGRTLQSVASAIGISDSCLSQIERDVCACRSECSRRSPTSWACT